MKKFTLLIFIALVTAGMAMAQWGTDTPGAGGNVANTPNTVRAFNAGADILGAHNNYGRGCVACHAPHSGSAGNNAPNSDPTNGQYALWGESLSPLFGKTLVFSGDFRSTGSRAYSVTLPTGITAANTRDGATIVLLCLSCHDGVNAEGAMMQGTTVEPLPIVGGHAPTLLGAQSANPYSNDHPVGPNANVSCGPPYNWDCTGGGNSTTGISYTSGANMTQFVNIDYPGSFWYGTTATSSPLASFGSTTVNGVTCTTCHNQHSETVYSNGNPNGPQGAGTVYTTMFFIKGQYNPNSNGNSVAQFCRNCHGGESNEMNGLIVPTT